MDDAVLNPASLPPVLAGPVLRRVTRTSVSIWVAFSGPGAVSVHVRPLGLPGAEILAGTASPLQGRQQSLAHGRHGRRPRRGPCRLPGSPADHDTGALERVRRDGSLTPVTTSLDQPTSVEIVDRTAYIVTLSGQVWTAGGLVSARS